MDAHVANMSSGCTASCSSKACRPRPADRSLTGIANRLASRSESKPKVLYRLPQPPAIRPGGAEGYALDLYEAMRDGGEFEPVFLARTGAPSSAKDVPPLHPLHALHARSTTTPTSTSSTPTCRASTGSSGGRPTKAITTGSSATSCSPTSPTSSTSSTRSSSATTSCASPEHAAGRADRLHAARVPADLPPRRADGAHARATSSAARSRRGAATSASPWISPQDVLRCASASSSPSSRSSTCSSRRASTCATATSTGASRAEKIQVEPYALPAGRALAEQTRTGRATASPSSASSLPTRAPTCCWRRWRMLGEDFDGHLWIHGANLETQRPRVPGAVQRAARRRPRSTVTFAGPYDHATELHRIMIGDRLGGRALDLVGDRPARGARGIPARPAGDLQRHRRHVREGRRTASAACTSGAATRRTSRTVLKRAATTPGLWEELRAGIPPVYDITRSRRES